MTFKCLFIARLKIINDRLLKVKAKNDNDQTKGIAIGFSIDDNKLKYSRKENNELLLELND